MQSRILVLFAALIGAGCVLETDEPLSDPASAEADPSMYGHWVVPPQPGEQNGNEIHMFIGKHEQEQNPEGIMECASIPWNPKNLTIGGKPSKFYFTVTKIGKERYMNVLRDKDEKELIDLSEKGSYARWAANKDHRCAIFRYMCDGKTLQICNHEFNVLKRLTKDKVLARNEVEGDEYCTTESLLKYLNKEGGETLFPQVQIEAKKTP